MLNKIPFIPIVLLVVYVQYVCIKALILCIMYKYVNLFYLIFLVSIISSISGYKLVFLIIKWFYSKSTVFQTTKTIVTSVILIFIFAGTFVGAQRAIKWIASDQLIIGQENDRAGDYKKAFFHYKRSALLGNLQAQYNIGSLYREGIGVKKDVKKALKWLKKAASKKEPRALADIGIMLYEGDVIEKDSINGINYLKKASNEGNLLAKQKLIQINRSIDK